MVWIMHTCAPPQIRQDQEIRCVGEREAYETVMQWIVGENSHRDDCKHLKESQNARSEIVRAMVLVIETSIQPRPPNYNEQQTRLAKRGQIHMSREAMRNSRYQHHKDKIVEQLEVGNAPFIRPVPQRTRGMPKVAKPMLPIAHFNPHSRCSRPSINNRGATRSVDVTMHEI